LKCEPPTTAKPDLAEHFESSGKSLLVLLENLDVVVKKSNQTEPYGGNDQQQDIYVFKLGKEQRGHQDCRNNNETSHRGCAFLFHLSLQAQVAYFLTHLFAAEEADEILAEEDGNEKRKERCHPCAK